MPQSYASFGYKAKCFLMTIHMLLLGFNKAKVVIVCLTVTIKTLRTMKKDTDILPFTIIFLKAGGYSTLDYMAYVL